MIKLECNDCKKPIEESDNHYSVPQLNITENKRRGQAVNLHFCSIDCFHSWLVKSANRPNLIVPNGAAQ